MCMLSRITFLSRIYSFIVKPDAHRYAPGFFKIVFVWKSICMCLPPMLLITSGVIWIQYDWLNKFFSFYMAVVVGIISRHDLRIEALHKSQPNNSKLALYYPSQKHLGCKIYVWLGLRKSVISTLKIWPNFEALKCTNFIPSTSTVTNISSYMQHSIRNSKRFCIYSPYRIGDKYHNMTRCVLCR